MKKIKKKQEGITLIALAVTIVVLLILAWIGLSMIWGENGIFNKAEQSVEETSYRKALEKLMLAWNICYIDSETGEKLQDGTDYFSKERLNQYLLNVEEIEKITYDLNSKMYKGTLLYFENNQKYDFEIDGDNNISLDIHCEHEYQPFISQSEKWNLIDHNTPFWFIENNGKYVSNYGNSYKSVAKNTYEAIISNDTTYKFKYSSNTNLSNYIEVYLDGRKIYNKYINAKMDETVTMKLTPGRHTLTISAKKWSWSNVTIEIELPKIENSEQHKCKKCGKVEMHELNECIIAPVTCENAGTIRYYCDCGLEYTVNYDALTHNYIKKDIIKYADKDNPGEYKYLCDRCNKEVIKEYVTAENIKNDPKKYYGISVKNYECKESQNIDHWILYHVDGNNMIIRTYNDILQSNMPAYDKTRYSGIIGIENNQYAIKWFDILPDDTFDKNGLLYIDYLLNQQTWNAYINENAEYGFGASPIKMFKDSWNALYPTRKIEYKISDDNSALLWRIQSEDGSFGEWNQSIALPYNHTKYMGSTNEFVSSNPHAYSMAFPLFKSYYSSALQAVFKGERINQNGYTSYSRFYHPVVALKENCILVKNSDEEYILEII